MSGRKIIDLAKAQKTATFIEVCRPWIESIEVEADALPRAGFHLGVRQQLASDTLTPPVLLDPEMTDVAPSPMGEAVKSADEHVAVISENRKWRLVAWAKARRNLGP